MKTICLLVVCTVVSFGAGQPRIINGTQVMSSDNQWDAIVSIRTNAFAYCGGSLISPTWVLTAAHCIEAYIPTKIGYGGYALWSMSERSVKNYFVHPQYDGNMIDNDIALIELYTAIEDVEPMILDRNDLLAAGTQTWVAGWGDTNIDPDEATYPENLMEVLVPLVEFDTCNQAYGYGLTSNMICAEYMSGGYDSCQGDSGGPLAVQKNNHVLQLGIVSFGMDCAESGYPGVYTKVQNYIDWIESYTGPLAQPSGTQGLNPAVLMYLLN
ncbi:MAG: serine protease [Campylobacterales bacterium]|nr:serine protease [Campylobacterales bacterium]